MNRQELVALLSGILFGLGLAIAQMTDPNKVLNFLDFTGHWDPSLALVMGAALLVAVPGFRFVLRRPAPRWAPAFELPKRRDIDRRLLAGSALFGIGWGICGFCPGPAIVSLSTLSSGALVIVLAMAAGALLHDLVFRRRGAGAVKPMPTPIS